MEALVDSTTVESVVVGLLVVSELLGTFGVFKTNSIFQLVVSILKKLAPKKK